MDYVDSATMVYVVSGSFPGCLPDVGPVVFATSQKAQAYLSELADDYVGDIDNDEEDGETGLVRYLDEMSFVTPHNMIVGIEVSPLRGLLDGLTWTTEPNSGVIYQGDIFHVECFKEARTGEIWGIDYVTPIVPDSDRTPVAIEAFVNNPMDSSCGICGGFMARLSLSELVEVADEAQS